MISFLEGTVVSRKDGLVVLDVNGVGYALHMARSSALVLPAPGERVRILCRLSLSDAGVFLYGFIDEDERELFDLLTAISGVGPKMALAAISTYDVRQLETLIAAQDVKAISKVPGIGKKTASRIILELKDAFDIDASGADEMVSNADTQALVGVTEALSSMGFTTAEITAALEGAPVEGDEATLLQYALRRMA